MWLWMRRWRDWAMHDLWSMHRTGPQPQALHYSYEKAGLTVHDEPIPWNAEFVSVEGQLRLPASVARRKSDFQLRIPGHLAISPESLRRQQGDDRYRLIFRFPPPGRTVKAELLWRHRHLWQITLPYLNRDEFLQHLRLEMPTLFVRLGEQSVACQTFVSTQCKGLLASAVLTSPTSLAPLVDLGVHVEFRSERGGAVQVMAAQLTKSQLLERQALVTIVPRRLPRRIGTWTASWLIGERLVVTQRTRAVSMRHFQRSLRLADTRFVVETNKGHVRMARQLPGMEEIKGAGPCFMVISREPGMAGLCCFQVRVQVNGAVQAPLIYDQEVLVTDGPTLVAPGTLSVEEFNQISGFELFLKEESLGVLSTSPIPEANFTAEGGFKASADYTWTNAADEELTDRLNRLLDERSK